MHDGPTKVRKRQQHYSFPNDTYTKRTTDDNNQLLCDDVGLWLLISVGVSCLDEEDKVLRMFHVCVINDIVILHTTTRAK